MYVKIIFMEIFWKIMQYYLNIVLHLLVFNN